MQNNRKRFLTGIWPVVQRELREGARRRVNHRLRFWSGVFGAVLLGVVAADNAGKPPAEIGAWLLVSLHLLLLGLIFLVVPLLAADCIAREKRDGTLGLLFLTPLNAGGIVAGKVISVALRAFTLWLAVLPVLVVPFLEGGINWLDASAAVIIEFCAAVLCLAAGLLATSLTEKRNMAVTLGLGFAVVFLASFAMLVTGCFFVMSGFFARAGVPVFDVEWLMMISGAIMSGLDGGGWYRMVLFVGTTRLWYAFCAVSPLLVLFFAWMIGRFASRRLERSWQDKVPTVQQQRLIQRYCTPLFRQRFRRKMQRSLDWNPIAWLQQYSWKARAGKWGLCLGFTVLGLAAPAVGSDAADGVMIALSLMLLGIYSFVAIASFLDDKRNGAIELILVAPIPVNSLIFGRVWGLWKQFLPAALILFVLVVLQNPSESMRTITMRDLAEGLCDMASIFIPVPIYASCFALRSKNAVVAGVLTWAALAIPILPYLLDALFDFSFPLPYSKAANYFISAVLAMSAWWLLHRSLSRRIYSF